MKNLLPQFSLAKKIDKAWGYELLGDNNFESNYCQKILHYDKKGNESSFHFHPLHKVESFLCINGSFIFRYFDNLGNVVEKKLEKFDVVRINKGIPHQLQALEDNSEIFEASTYDCSLDIIRVKPGDGQK